MKTSRERTKSGAADRGWPLVLAVLGALVVIGWAYMAAMIADMIPAMDMSETGPGMGLFNIFNSYRGLSAEARAALAVLCLPNQVATFGMPAETWGWLDAGKVFLMWLMMSLAMMVPSAVPMFRAYMRRHHAEMPLRKLQFATLLVALGYTLIWIGYAVAATGAQWLMTQVGYLSPMMAPISLAFSASVLVAAGIYQFTPAKRACLTRCWYPRFSIGPHKGTLGALEEGVAQGIACLGCCWAIMAVMFAVGLMNIIWIAILGVLIAVEKTFAYDGIRRFIGVFMVVWGCALAAFAQSGILI
ncbi:DUF2182 domain-containing protein [Roseibium sp.]|uniref:DUF2182 domain-containing protein n=1 Tax=Roseibium sp. TaxID=1936156 RepID=UPI003A97803E